MPTDHLIGRRPVSGGVEKQKGPFREARRGEFQAARTPLADHPEQRDSPPKLGSEMTHEHLPGKQLFETRGKRRERGSEGRLGEPVEREFAEPGIWRLVE
jgi:hypothetical protein